jgi:predicted PurR-regulated permease PerM
MANWRILLWATIVLAALGLLYAVRAILLPFALAWIIAVLLEPVVRRMRLKGLSRGLSVTLITIGFFVAVGGLLAASAPRVTGQLSELRTRVQTLADAAAAESRDSSHFSRWNPAVRAEPPGPLGMVDRTLDRLAPSMGRLGLPSSRRAIMEQYVEPQQEEIATAAATFFNGFVRMIGGAASQMFMLLLVPLLVFLFLMDMEKIQVQTASWIPPSIRAGTLSVFADIGGVFKKFLRGVTINIAIYSTVMALLLSIIGVPYSLVLAIVAGIFYLIPMIGQWFTVPVILIVVGMSGQSRGWFIGFESSWVFGIAAATIFILVSMVYDMGVNPRVVGKSVDLHPLVSMFVVFSGGALFGLPGMVLAFPIAGSLKVTLTRLLKLTGQAQADGQELPAVPLRHRHSAREG